MKAVLKYFGVLFHCARRFGNMWCVLDRADKAPVNRIRGLIISWVDNNDEIGGWW